MLQPLQKACTDANAVPKMPQDTGSVLHEEVDHRRGLAADCLATRACRRRPPADAGRGRRTRVGHRHRLAHPAHRDRGRRPPRLDQRRRAAQQWLHVGVPGYVGADRQPRRPREQPEYQRLLAGSAGRRPARSRAEPHAGPRQRPAHRGLSAAVPGHQQLHRHLLAAAVAGRSHRDPERQRLGHLRLGRDLRRRQLHPEEEGRRCDAGPARRVDAARRRHVGARPAHRRVLDRAPGRGVLGGTPQ